MYCNFLVYEDPYENHFGDKAFLVKYCIYYYYYYYYYITYQYSLYRGVPPSPSPGLPTTITPERAKVRRKLQGTSAKQLFKEQNTKGEINNLLNFDRSPTDIIETDTSDTDKTESKVHVVRTYPKGDVVVKKLFDKCTVSLLRSVERKQWKTAANVVFNHDVIKAQIPEVMRRQVTSEFRLLS